MATSNFLVIKEVAKALRVSQRSVMRYIKSKKLCATKIGQWRIKTKDLERFINQNSNRKN
jgi:excisionase family DNA binding protein